MSFKKKILAIAAVGALGAVTALPAMALENQFSGTYRLRYFLSNYENGNGGFLAPETAKKDKLQMNNYFEQRARLFYTAKANDDLKLVTGFEIDSVFGDKAQGGIYPSASATTAFRNSGGALESDAVNLETKHVYLQFNVPSTTTTVIAGIQPFKDQLKGIFIDADVAGIAAVTKLGKAGSLTTAYVRGYENWTTDTTSGARGMQNLDIGVIEGKYAYSKDTSLGGVYYIYADNRPTVGNLLGNTKLGTSTMLHVLGVTGETKLGNVALSGFFAYQGGDIRNVTAAGDSAYLNAFAYNVAAKIPAGSGTLKTAFLFTSGNGEKPGKHYTGWIGGSQSPAAKWSANSGVSTYNESGMLLLNRNAAASTGTTDLSLVYNTGNGTNPVNMQGLYLVSAGYDMKFSPKLYLNANVGAAWTAHTNSLKPTDHKNGGLNSTNYMGTEVNIETGYKMYDNLTASFQAGYVILGGYYKNSLSSGKTPEDPYTMRTSLIYNF